MTARRAWRRLAAGTLLAAALLVAAAPPSRAAGLREGFAGALALDAELRALEAQREVVAARRARVDALLPGAPLLSGGVRSDLLFQDRGYLQIEGAGAAPLWLPGEARALRGAAEAEGASLSARLARQRLLLAGGVRDAYWAWAAAAAEAEAQRARLREARALEADLSRQERAGNVARADLLIATAAVREAEGALRERQQAARGAAIAFRTLTGAEPTTGQEEIQAGEALRPASDDPRLAAARAAVEAGRAGERLAAARDRANPELLAQIRPQRETRGEDLSPNLLVAGRTPLRHGPTYREGLAEARANVLTAEAEARTAERALRGALDRAREGRAAALDLLRLSGERHAALAEQARLTEAAWRGGQLPLIEVVRVRGQLADADAARRRARAEAGRSASEINQVLGVEPR